MNGYVSYMDILGFASKIRATEFRNKYNALITFIGDKFKEDSKVTVDIVSDSVVVISKELNPIKDYARMIYGWALRNDFWVRGAITQGELEKVVRSRIVRSNGNIVIPYLGDAYLHAVRLEKQINMAGIIIDDTVKSDNPDLPLDVEYVDGFMEYREYLPKTDNENKKKLLLPSANEEILIIDSLHFQEMLKSHTDDIDKYINTFCFYIKLFLARSPKRNVRHFVKRLIEQLKLHGRRFLIPQKVIIIFVAAIDALIERNNDPSQKYTQSLLKSDISRILDALKAQGYLSAFSDYLLEFDNKRTTNLFENVRIILSDGNLR